jgi:hypothetical protein
MHRICWCVERTLLFLFIFVFVRRGRPILREVLQFALFMQPVNCAMDLSAFVFEKPGNSRGKTRLGKKVHADGRLRIKPTQPFKIASGSWLEPHELMLNTVMDGCVITDIKVQMPHVFERSPIAPIEHAVFLNVERPRDNLPAMPSNNKAQISLETFA